MSLSNIYFLGIEWYNYNIINKGGTMMGWYDDWAKEMEDLERERESLVKTGEDREIGIIGQAEVQAKIDEIDRKLGRK